MYRGGDRLIMSVGQLALADGVYIVSLSRHAYIEELGE